MKSSLRPHAATAVTVPRSATADARKASSTQESRYDEPPTSASVGVKSRFESGFFPPRDNSAAYAPPPAALVRTEGAPSWLRDCCTELSRSEDPTDWVAALGLVARLQDRPANGRSIRDEVAMCMKSLPTETLDALTASAHRRALALHGTLKNALREARAFGLVVPPLATRAFVAERDRLQSIATALWLAGSGGTMMRLCAGIDDDLDAELALLGDPERWACEHYTQVACKEPEAWWGTV